MIFRRGEKKLNRKCVYWFCLQLSPETFLILRRIQQDIFINVHRPARKLLLFLLDLNETWIFSMDFWKILKISYFTKIHQWVPKSTMQTETDSHIWRNKSWRFRGNRIQLNFLRQTASSGCEGLPTFWELTPSPSSGCTGGLVAEVGPVVISCLPKKIALRFDDANSPFLQFYKHT